MSRPNPLPAWRILFTRNPLTPTNAHSPFFTPPRPPFLPTLEPTKFGFTSFPGFLSVQFFESILTFIPPTFFPGTASVFTGSWDGLHLIREPGGFLPDPLPPSLDTFSGFCFVPGFIGGFLVFQDPNLTYLA